MRMSAIEQIKIFLNAMMAFDVQISCVKIEFEKEVVIVKDFVLGDFTLHRMI